MTKSLKSLLMLSMLVVSLLLTSCSKDAPTTPVTKTYAIKGRITPKSTEDVAGVGIVVGTKNTTTAADGTWSIGDMVAGSYSVAPAKTDQMFEPMTRSVTVVDAEVTGVDFVMSGPSSASTHPEMIDIPSGTFLLGARNAVISGPYARPRHQVTLAKPFAIAITEVTQEQYEAVVGTNPSTYPNPPAPVENVSLLQIVAYCNALSALEGLQPAYTFTGSTFSWNRAANGYRLPTNAEWEYAARAGDTNNTYNGYNDGKDPNAVVEAIAWYRFNSAPAPDFNPELARASPVGQKLPNAWGLFDVLGNAWEIVYDGFAPYTSDAKTDPVVDPDFVNVTIRGGSMSEDGGYCNLASRQSRHIADLNFAVGFRIARNR